MSKRLKISILGGGPAGIATAYYAKSNNIDFELYEAAGRFGGNCVTFKNGDFRFDSGAHRLHAKDEETIEIVKSLLGDDLFLINVPSQIFRDNQYIDFPLSPLNIAQFLGPKRVVISAKELAVQMFMKKKSPKNFQELAIKRYGNTIAKLFLLDYTAKLWGKKSAELSLDVAGKRLKGLTLKTFIIESIWGQKRKTNHLDGSFYYPKYGIGSIFDCMIDYCGLPNCHSNSRITKIFHNQKNIQAIEVNEDKPTKVDQIVSSLPLGIFLKLLHPKPPQKILAIASKINFRNLVLVAFFLKKKYVNKNGSMYFPENTYPFTRIYEPRNRSKHMSPEGYTSLIVEIPCQAQDNWWSMKEEELTSEIQNQLTIIGFFNAEDVVNSQVKYIQHAYPILENGYKDDIKCLSDYLEGFDNLTFTGRNGLFAYTHIHDHMINARKIIDQMKLTN